MGSEMNSRFDFKTLEPKIYTKWEKSGFFNPDNLVKKGIIKKDAKPFSIMLPPPNVTGILHMGSALMLVIEDIMIEKGLASFFIIPFLTRLSGLKKPDF